MRKALAFLGFMFLNFLLVVTSAVMVTSQNHLIELQYSLPGIEETSDQFSLDERIHIANQTLAAVKSDDMQMELTSIKVDSEKLPLYSPAEIEHLVDLGIILEWIRDVYFGLWLLFFVFLIFTYRFHSWERFLQAIIGGCLLALICVLGLGLWMFFFWERFFVLFHELLFSPGTWSFPAESALIQLFPEIFWVRYGLIYVFCVLLSALLVIGASLSLIKKI